MLPKNPHGVRPVPVHLVGRVPVDVVGRVPVHVVGAVTVSRDGWDWAAFWIGAAGAFAAVIAIVIALAAIWWAARIGQGADLALIRERQLTFELGVLLRIAELETLSPQGAVPALSALVAALPKDELALHRSNLNKGDLPNARTLTSGAPNEVLAELVEAIKSRMITTSPPRLTMRVAALQAFGRRSKGDGTTR